MFRLLLTLFISMNLFSSCIKNLYFIGDPYWETATGISFLNIRFIGLKNGYLVRIISTSDNDQWLSSEEQTIETSLKVRIESLLNKGHKLLLSPYWLRDLEEHPLQFPQNQQQNKSQLILLDATSSQTVIQSIVTDIEGGYYIMGQVAGNFIQNHSEREKVIAIFYRGYSYDKYFQSFQKGFKQVNPDQSSLVSQRYYAAEINQLIIFLESIDVAKSVVILGMAHLSNQIYRVLSADEQSLFMAENFSKNMVDSTRQVLLSLDTDYAHLVEQAMHLAPISSTSSISENGQEYITKEPYVLHLPNPRLVSDIEPIQELAKQAIQKERRHNNRPDIYIARIWNQVLDFFLNLNFLN